MRAWALIAAGGKGKRMEAKTPKQLLKLNGVTILERTLKPFLDCHVIEGIVIVTENNIIENINNIVSAIPSGLQKISVVKT